MNRIIDETLSALEESGNMRSFPEGEEGGIDFSSNDYLGLSVRTDLRDRFLAGLSPADFEMSASASRLLALRQNAFTHFEKSLEKAYGEAKRALLFNSGYHANTGLVSAFAGTGAYILADKLVHASIIDGIKLSGLPFARFRHNDMAHLDRLAAKAFAEGRKLIIIAESVYSMDGDSPDIDALVEIRNRYPGSLLYIDEAHAVGVCGPAGLGLAKASGLLAEVDIVVGTLGKALASTGAYAILGENLRRYMINRARSLIFSTAIPPLNMRWSRFVFEESLGMDSERQHLRSLCSVLAGELSTVGGRGAGSHIQTLICGDPKKAVDLSGRLRKEGFLVLPIRTPTVPPGTDRLRISLSAACTQTHIRALGDALRKISPQT